MKRDNESAIALLEDLISQLKEKRIYFHTLRQTVEPHQLKVEFEFQCLDDWYVKARDYDTRRS
jgi:hypothetical protein